MAAALRWTEAELAALSQRKALKQSVAHLAAQLGRSKKSVENRIAIESKRQFGQRQTEMRAALRLVDSEYSDPPPPSYVLREREIRLSIPPASLTAEHFVDPVEGYSALATKLRKLSVQDALEICALHTGRRGELFDLAETYGVSTNTIKRVLDGSFFDQLLPPGMSTDDQGRLQMINGSNSGWTEARINTLVGLWLTDMKPDAIALELGGFEHTRDGGRKAVIGKANRMGLQPKRAKAVPPTAEELDALRLTRRQRQVEREKARVRMRSKSGTPPQSRAEPKPQTPKPDPFLGALNIAFGELRQLRVAEPNQCRFIEGGAPDYLACANETLPGASWCGHHHAIVYSKAVKISDSERERRSRNATKNWKATQVKMQGARGEEAFA